MSRTSWRWALGIGPLVLLIVWATSPLMGQSAAPKVGEWRTYGGDHGRTARGPPRPSSRSGWLAQTRRTK